MDIKVWVANLKESKDSNMNKNRSNEKMKQRHSVDDIGSFPYSENLDEYVPWDSNTRKAAPFQDNKEFLNKLQVWAYLWKRFSLFSKQSEVRAPAEAI